MAVRVMPRGAWRRKSFRWPASRQIGRIATTKAAFHKGRYVILNRRGWIGTMPTRRTIILTAAGAVMARPASAAGASAHDFVAAIYETYVGKNGNGIALDNEQTVRRYFEPSLAELMLRDQQDAARRDETPALDFDPFVDGQDWDIAAFSIAVSDGGADKASATVTFNNFGKPTKVVLDLVRVKSDWRIADITWTPHDKPNSLRALYAQ
jgi:hypothetical protein